MHGESVARLRVWDAITEDIIDRQANVPREGRSAIVTAGPPGAGKSTLIAATTGERGSWRHVDPDEVKELLIRQALRDGDYEQLLRKTLSDGRPIMPWELAGLVHVESVKLAADIRHFCMQRGENIVIEGTLSWEGVIDTHLSEIAEYGYDELQILSIEIPKAVAHERALERWWAGRDDSESELGGRFVPQSAISACYDPDSDTSRCRRNAEELRRRAKRLEGLRVGMLATGFSRLSDVSVGTVVSLRARHEGN